MTDTYRVMADRVEDADRATIRREFHELMDFNTNAEAFAIFDEMDYRAAMLEAAERKIAILENYVAELEHARDCTSYAEGEHSANSCAN